MHGDMSMKRARSGPVRWVQGDMDWRWDWNAGVAVTQCYRVNQTGGNLCTTRATYLKVSSPISSSVSSHHKREGEKKNRNQPTFGFLLLPHPPYSSASTGMPEG